MTQTKTYELIATEVGPAEYTDEYSCIVIATLADSTGHTDTVWLEAGIPDYLRGTAQHAQIRDGYEGVRLAPMDCVIPAEWREDADAIVALCAAEALREWREIR